MNKGNLYEKNASTAEVEPAVTEEPARDETTPARLLEILQRMERRQLAFIKYVKEFNNAIIATIQEELPYARLYSLISQSISSQLKLNLPRPLL